MSCHEQLTLLKLFKNYSFLLLIKMSKEYNIIGPIIYKTYIYILYIISNTIIRPLLYYNNMYNYI